MSLRYRLFLWVSGLFVVLATCSFFLENYVSHRELAKAQKIVRAKILDMSEQRRLDLQTFLGGSIAETQVRIDAILNILSGYSRQALRFGPTTQNAEKGTWGDASDLLLEYKWIDFLQNTNEGKTTSGLIPRPNAFNTAFRMEIDEDLSWIYLSDLEKHPDPYLSVRVPYSLVTNAKNNVTDQILEQLPGVVPSGYLLFDLKNMQETFANASQPVLQGLNQPPLAPITVKWTEGYELDPTPFVTAFQRARELLISKKLQPPQLSIDEVKAKMQDAEASQNGKLIPVPTEKIFTSLTSEALVKERLEQIGMRYTEINVIWLLIAMFDSGMFGNDLFAFPAPDAVTVFSQHNAVGAGLFAKDVLFSEPLFDDCSYYQANTPKDPQSNLGTSLAVIPIEKTNTLFLGNTAKLSVRSVGNDRTGYMTIGIDADSILQRLVLAVHQPALLVHNGRPYSAYDENGVKIDLTKSHELPLAKMLTERSGILPWDNVNYYYMNVRPFSEVDLHFFLFNPEEKEFALLHDLETGSEEVVSTILLNIHIEGLIGLLIAILVLNNITRKVTRPIIQLAQATEDVVEGRLDEIKLSLPPLKHNDEIAVLCHSFEEMVKGLQEKEKVKGVLNKVVSREIAQEILKGNVHLGGEEKKVSVLFADIRDFTKMTQNMPPQEVIDLLNVCMTKISQVIDKNGGVIDKYVGDEAMALFGAPISRGADAFNAIKSAIEMTDVIKGWNAARIASSQAPIELGIGIHTGQMLAGNMGAENRLNYTVIGSSVNLAARLCSAAKRMEILITKDTLEEPFVKERIIYEQMPAVVFKGFDKPVDIYRVQGIKK